MGFSFLANKCFTHTQARVLRVMVKQANIRTLTRSRRPHERDYSTAFLPKAPLVLTSHKNHSVHLFSKLSAGSPPKSRKLSSSQSAEQVLTQELEAAASLVESDAVPSEVAVQRALTVCEGLARSVVEPVELPETRRSLDKTPTSNLLSLDEQSRVPAISSPTALSSPLVKSQVADKISSTAYTIITNPKVFITPALLATYVYTQSVLRRPQSFPRIFDLYASKLVPQSGRLPITYKDPNPNRASSAVPFVLAQSALAVAIEAQNLPLCLSIINTSVRTTAYKRNKLLRRALLPFSALALTPVAAYVLASQLANYQHSMDHQIATNMAFAGILAYVGFTATIGLVAVATSNDQMDRITWAIGTPLLERWLREDERSLVDRVAGAWGFQDVNKRGEEEGEDWEMLREWALMRGMILDKPELMEGME